MLKLIAMIAAAALTAIAAVQIAQAQAPADGAALVAHANAVTAREVGLAAQPPRLPSSPRAPG